MNPLAKRQEQQILSDLNEITTPYSFINILAAIAYRDFCGPIDELESKNVHEHLNYNEFSFLIGLWLKNVDIGETSYANEPDLLIDKTDELMLELHQSIAFGSFDNDKPIDSIEAYLHSGDSVREAIFYSATGAYDYSYIQWLSIKYDQDKDWLWNEKGIDLKIIPEFYRNIKKRCQQKLAAFSPKKRSATPEDILPNFCLTDAELTMGNPKYKSLLSNLVNIPGHGNNNNFLGVGDINSFLEKPIILLPDGKYFIPVPFFVAEALYESPFYWMNNDKKYLPTASENRGKIAERIVYEQIQRIFGKKNTYKSVLIKKSKKEILTDIDVIATHGDQAVIFQIKSKKLTALSKKGDLKAIKNDFKKAVLNAGEQAQLSIRALQNPTAYIFQTENEVDFHLTQKAVTCYPVVVLLDNYPAVLHQTRILLDENSGTAPIAFNIFDLEIILYYLKTPEKFIEYISKRAQHSKFYFASNEMELLGYYLEHGLERSDKHDGIGLDNSWGQAIDHKYYSQLVGIKATIAEVRAGTASPNRNDFCPCGSGIKYKKCHMGKL